MKKITLQNMSDVASSVEQMSSVNGHSEQPVWLSKADAAAFLGVSARQIERRAAQGYVETRRLPRRPTERSERVEYSRVDLEAIRDGRPNQHGVPDLADENPVTEEPKSLSISTSHPQNGPALAPVGFMGDLGSFIGAFTAAIAPAPTPKPWLTLKEAAEFSGLPANYLLREARAGHLIAMNVGSEKRVSWRFHREALTRTSL